MLVVVIGPLIPGWPDKVTETLCPIQEKPVLIVFYLWTLKSGVKFSGPRMGCRRYGCRVNEASVGCCIISHLSRALIQELTPLLSPGYQSLSPFPHGAQYPSLYLLFLMRPKQCISCLSHASLLQSSVTYKLHTSVQLQL